MEREREDEKKLREGVKKQGKRKVNEITPLFYSVLALCSHFYAAAAVYCIASYSCLPHSLPFSLLFSSSFPHLQPATLPVYEVLRKTKENGSS